MKPTQLIEDMVRQLKLVMRLTKELHDSPISLHQNLTEGSVFMSESVEKSPEAIAAINMMEAKNEKLAKALKEMVNQFAYIPGMADMVHDERSAVMNARDALKFNETGKHV